MGEKSRLIQCSEILLKKGHQIYGVISLNSQIGEWVKERRLQLISPKADFVKIMKAQPFDIFLSIDNLFKVPNEILTMPRKYAINFHDGPLPRYAGNNATNWALMNQETIHGITWHVMTEVIDAGDILKQITFPISKDDTAITLNAKCYQKSIEAFDELIEEIAGDRVILIKQNLENRSFFPLWKRPFSACAIDWSNSAESIYALVRALDYGSYPNPLGLPKIVVGERVFILKNMEILKPKSTAAPGTITLMDSNKLNFATGTYDVCVLESFSMNGDTNSLPAFLKKGGFVEGDKLPRLDEELAEKITKANSTICKHEEYWVKRLTNLEPVEIPYAKRKDVTEVRSISEKRFLIGEPGFYNTKVGLEEGNGNFLMGAFTLYLARIGGKAIFDVNYRDEKLAQQIYKMENIFASHVPLHILIEWEKKFEDNYHLLKNEIKAVRLHETYALDLTLRDPSLGQKSIKKVGNKLPVAIERVRALSDLQGNCGADLLVGIPDDGREMTWIYNEGVLDETTIVRMWEQFNVLLTNIGDGENLPVGKLNILPQEERNRVLFQWNETQVHYPRDRCLHELFERQVEQTPDSVALVFEGKQLTYRELNGRANQLANFLRSLGVGPEVLVGIFMERSLEMVIAIYGILKAGGAYLPLDPEYPPERVAFMARDAKASVLLTQKHLAANLPEEKETVICLDSDWSGIAKHNSQNLARGVAAENLAYVIYTSGSTGMPKGAMNTHRGICNRLLWMQDEYQMTDRDRVLQKTPFSFDVSVWEFFWPLLVGAQLVVSRPGGHRDSNYLVKLIQGEEITTIHFVPSMLEIFLEEKGVEQCRSLKRVICSGEALPYELQERFFAKLEAELHNLYGPTEAAVDVTYWACRRGSDQRIVPIGHPVANTQMYILDSYLQPVPIGVPGELYIGGIQVGRGYLNRPELTAEKFIPDPFSSSPGARLYRTGDLARFLPAGEIEYLGRLDHQVKIRGLRIELGEIETVLSEHKGVNQALIAIRENALNDKTLVAYLVPKTGCEVTAGELREHLRKRLPEYMIPQYFVILKEFPLLPNGKIDRRGLPTPHLGRQTDTGFTAPQSEVEKIIAYIWKDLLKIESVGIHDNFFELGGHSMLLVKMIAKLRDSFQKEIPIVELFRYPTISALARFITGKEEKKDQFESTKELVQKQKAFLKRRKQLAQAKGGRGNG